MRTKNPQNALPYVRLPIFPLLAILVPLPAGATPMSTYPVEVTLSIHVEDDRVQVRSRFENTGDRTVFVKEGEYGYGFGDQDRKCVEPGVLGNPEFVILTERDEPIRYKGIRSHRAPPAETSFKPITPGQVIDVRCTGLSQSYGFLPGTHNYKIYHIHIEYDKRRRKLIFHHSGEIPFVYTKR